jgi:hypothetical protein
MLRMLCMLLVIRWMVNPLVLELLWTILWRTLLVPMRCMTLVVALVVASLQEPPVPASVTVTAEVPSPSPFIILAGAIIQWMNPEVGVEPRSIESCVIVDLLVPMGGSVSMSASTCNPATTACSPSATTSAIAPFPSAITDTCCHGYAYNLCVRRMEWCWSGG